MDKLDLTDLELSPLFADRLAVMLGPSALVPLGSQRKPVGGEACVELRHQTRWSVRLDPDAPVWSVEETHYCILGCPISEIKACLDPGGKRCQQADS